MKKTIISATMIGTKVNVFINGSYHQKDFNTPELALNFLHLVQKAKTDETSLQEVKNELNKLHKVDAYGIFEKDLKNNYYLKGTETAVPELLMQTFISYIENKLDIEPLVKFWKLCLINPDKRVRADLFKFLSQYNFAITDEGMFIAYKAVTHKELVDNDLIAFISNQWLKIKKWKEAPKNYSVVMAVETYEEEVEEDWSDDNDEDFDDDFEPEYETKTRIYHKILKNDSVAKHLEDGTVKEVLGNLDEMYKGIESMLDTVDNTLYTDKHSRTMDIRVGLPVKQARKECDKDPRVECSNGLHVGSTKYVENFSSHGDSFLACLVNPMNVIAVPEYDNSKMRVCEYFPFAKLERTKDGSFETIDTDYFESDYVNMGKGELEKLYAKMLETENPLEYEADEKIEEKMEIIKRLIKIED